MPLLDFDGDLIGRALGGMCVLGPEDFQSAHFGAAILAAQFFITDAHLDDIAARSVRQQAIELAGRQSRWLHAPIASRPADPASLAGTLAAGADRLTALGHDLIFPSIALRLMHERPELATEAHLDGLARLVEVINREPPGGPFPGWADLDEAAERPDPSLPSLDSAEELAATTLQRFIAAGPVHYGMDQGVVHHALTHALALIELDSLGYQAAAARGRLAQRTYLTLLTRRPEMEGALPFVDERCTDVREQEWWSTNRRGQLEWLFGHVFKVPWAFRRLVDLAQPDDALPLDRHLSYTLSAS